MVAAPHRTHNVHQVHLVMKKVFSFSFIPSSVCGNVIQFGAMWRAIACVTLLMMIEVAQYIYQMRWLFSQVSDKQYNVTATRSSSSIGWRISFTCLNSPQVLKQCVYLHSNAFLLLLLHKHVLLEVVPPTICSSWLTPTGSITGITHDWA